MTLNAPDISSLAPDSFLYKRLTLAPGEEMDESRHYLVRITEDCRGLEESATGKIGLYLGKYDFETLSVDENDVVRNLEGAEKSDDGNPVIQIGENEYILGVQCFRQPIVKGETFDAELAKEQIAVFRQVYAVLMADAVVIEGSNDN